MLDDQSCTEVLQGARAAKVACYKIVQYRDLENALTMSSFSFAIYSRQEELALDQDPELDTTIAGPWMGQWEIVHHNRHTAQYKDPGDGESWSNYHSKWTKA